MIAISQIIINFETSRIIMQSLHMLRRIATLLLRVWRVILCVEIMEIMEKLDIKIINCIRS